MDSIEVAKIKPGQTLTLEFGEREAVLTKLDTPRLFKLEEWYMDECEIYILDDEIAEDEPLHYSFQAFNSLAAAQAANAKKFGDGKILFDFLGRPVGSIETDEEEDDEEE